MLFMNIEVQEKELVISLIVRKRKRSSKLIRAWIIQIHFRTIID